MASGTKIVVKVKGIQNQIQQIYKDCKNSLITSLKHLKSGAPELEIVAFELRESVNYIDALMGKTTVDDILNKVFSDFCVGK